MDDGERAYVETLQRTAAATVYVLERELSFKMAGNRRRKLTVALEGARADLRRCELVLSG